MLSTILIGEQVKTKWIILVIIISFSFSNSCTKKESVYACGFNHPEENILWLKQICEIVLAEDVYRLNYLGNEYIIISDEDLMDDGMSMAFDCQGQKVCEHGGLFPGLRSCNFNNPVEFWETYRAKKVPLFKIRNHKVISY